MASTKKRKKHTRKNSHHVPEITNVRNRPLRDLAEDALRKYLRDLNGDRPTALYELVLSEVEQPLLKTVLDYTDGNQSAAAEMLGINRATLRKKLRQHQLLG